jgi:Nickel-containing superoxide dismutase
MMFNFSSLLLLLTVSAVCVQLASAHCQVPCGIYDDEARIKAYEFTFLILFPAAGACS